MTTDKPYCQHLNSSDDLVTPYAAIRSGFVALALEKNRRATPFVEQARVLKAAASRTKTPIELADVEDIQPALLTAAGVSDKAAGYLDSQDKMAAIRGLIENFLEPAGANFIEELVFRFLLIRGDTLGGSMRNVGGILAQRKLTRMLLSTLTVAGKSYQWLHSRTNQWLQMTDEDVDIELQLKGLSWKNNQQSRTLIYNLTVPFIRNNVDLCLLRCSPQELATKKLAKATYKLPTVYLALGELKGGIDPAGADEHWKTARSALYRINQAFMTRELKPHTFFIGAAIAKAMAGEIWRQLQEETLTNAANLTDEDQLASISRWLCSL
ncbi:MAG: AvaI/BsoBI family type II restriction endonuclease [Coleofasciculus chthonoplastes F3-SA18-01]|uniref:AvaI/BsoBI family type II restriction endonuclease n=1 Tax=Coleofasciculus chthonoplastes TaxID=64178 RepID=UPI0032F86B18